MNLKELVALLAEGVDRNMQIKMHKITLDVALLAEGVDRNYYEFLKGDISRESPSSRRAWIEIVPRRLWPSRCCCRPPRGGRG